MRAFRITVHSSKQNRTVQVFLACILFFLLTPLYAIDRSGGGSVTYSSRIDWERGELIIEGEAALADRYSGAAAQAGRRIVEGRRSAFREAVLDLPVTSRETARAIMSETPTVVERLDERESLGVPEGVRPSRDLQSARREIRYPLYPTIGRAFQSHSVERPIPRSSGWVPSQEYTGVVIDARGELPVYGEQFRAAITPIILPRLYDSDSRLLLDASMIVPEYLEQWGVAGYTSDPGLSGPHAERVGPEPLYLAADQLFGTLAANPVVDAAYAEKLLTNDSNRQMLSQGRVVILVDEARLD